MESSKDVARKAVAALRQDRRLTVRSLSARLADLGRPIVASGITKIEAGTREINVGDLIALAVALEVNPNRLLFPVDGETEVALTPAVTAMPWQVWPWARGDQVLLDGRIAIHGGDESLGVAQDDFRRHALPRDERLREDHTAVRAAADVLASVKALLDRTENPERYERKDELRAKSPQLAASLGPMNSTPAGLRARLKRLVAEVEALIGDDDGS